MLDYGLWEPAEREHYKELAEAQGAQWGLVYFKADLELLHIRLAERNRRTDANALLVTDDMLGEFRERFEAPAGEGEIVIDQSAPRLPG